MVKKSFPKPTSSKFRFKHVYEIDHSDAMNCTEAVKQAISPTCGRIHVEPNIKFKARDTFKQATNSWALDCLDSSLLALNGFTTRHEYLNGTGQHVYVVDTGIDPDPSFGNPIQYDFDAYEDPPYHGDRGRHGTAVAGLIGSKLYGVAPYSTIHSIRVLDPEGNGFLSTVYVGIQHIYATATQPFNVVGMSLGASSGSPMLTALINDMVKNRGFTFVVSAGNDYGASSCQTYPAQLDSVIAVGATDIDGGVAYFSNIGSCNDIYAPGDGVVSIGAKSNSGTSFSQPIVAGIVSLIQQAKCMYPKNLPVSSALSIRTLLLQYQTTTNSKVPGFIANLDYTSLFALPTPHPPPPPPPPLLPPPFPVTTITQESDADEQNDARAIVVIFAIAFILAMVWLN